jgi:hypothetical protein
MSAFVRSATGVLITDSCHETVRNGSSVAQPTLSKAGQNIATHGCTGEQGLRAQWTVRLLRETRRS